MGLEGCLCLHIYFQMPEMVTIVYRSERIRKSCFCRLDSLYFGTEGDKHMVLCFFYRRLEKRRRKPFHLWLSWKPKISHQNQLNLLSAVYLSHPNKMLLIIQLYYLRMDNGMDPCLGFLLTHLLIQSHCRHSVMVGQLTCSTAHNAHTMSKIGPHSIWGQADPPWLFSCPHKPLISYPCLHFHSFFHISSLASYWLQSIQSLASNSAFKCSLSLWKHPFKSLQTDLFAFLTVSDQSTCFLVNCFIFTLVSLDQA